MPRKVTDADIAEMNRMRQERVPAEDIARALGVSRSSVIRHSKAVPRQADTELVKLLREEGKGTAEIARIVGLSTRQVQRIAPSGRPSTGLHRYTEEDKQRALALLKERSGYMEAARSIGADRHTVARWWPGYALTRQEAGVMTMVRKLDEIGDALW